MRPPKHFLKEMGWDEHQALLVAHNDKPHSHVHIELNRIHPETGKVLDDSFERRRASDWALEYERENGMVRCPQREAGFRRAKPVAHTRDVGKVARGRGQIERNEQAEQERAEGYLGKDESTSQIRSHEWQIIKDQQRADREAHFAEGKSAFREWRNEMHREVREHYREAWGGLLRSLPRGPRRRGSAIVEGRNVAQQREMFELSRQKRLRK